MGYKAGMTHIVRTLDRPGSKAHKQEIVEAVTVLFGMDFNTGDMNPRNSSYGCSWYCWLC